MRNVLSVTRMSSADAVAVNEKVQVVVADAVSTEGAPVVGAAVIDAASALKTATSTLAQTEAVTFEYRKEVDTGADRCLGAIIGRTENVIAAYMAPVVPLNEIQKQEFDAAQWLQDKCFPYGRSFIVGRWSEQFGITELILKTVAQPEAAPHLAILGLTGLFDLLQRIHAVYGERMGFTALQTGDTDSPLYKWHEALESYLGAVIYAHNKNPELKAKLAAPYESSAKAIRDARRRPQKETEPTTVSVEQ